jgi:tRNA 5-methylaminomethyl-2-thiouridine biosynthesis bifunctional protein
LPFPLLSRIKNAMTRPLIPARLAFADGVPVVETSGDARHSADDGPAQARHVFLEGNRLPQRWQGRTSFTILETGFGTGLNFMAAWQAWRTESAQQGASATPRRLHYIAIEKHPFSAADLTRLHALWPEFSGLSQALLAAWPPLLPGLHRLLLDGGQVVLTLAFGDIAECLPQIVARADAFFLGGFRPDSNPEMGDLRHLARLNRLAADGATLATQGTHVSSTAVNRALAQAGFSCKALPGFGGRGSMMAATYAPRWAVPPVMQPSARKAIVIGAGIAGSAACERLAARGWEVTLIERHHAAAQEASGNLAGIVMPLLSRDDNIPSRLARAGFLFSLRLAQRLGGMGQGFAGEACGVVQLAQDEAHARAQREILAQGAYPEDFARWMTPEEVASRIARPASFGGWLFPQGGWVRPASLCQALFDACGSRLEQRFGEEIVQLRRAGEEWQACNAQGRAVASAPVLILAQGARARILEQTRGLPLDAVRGQVTHIPAAVLPSLSMVVCGEGYVTPPHDGLCCVGATYDMDTESSLRAASQQENLGRLAQVLPQAIVPPLELAGRVGFRCVAPDRLPLVGALPDPGRAIAGSRLRDVPRLPGLYGLLGYASRGLIWAGLAAELLASQLEGEPLPVEAELAAALDPGRFALKAFRQRKAEQP